MFFERSCDNRHLLLPDNKYSQAHLGNIDNINMEIKIHILIKQGDKLIHNAIYESKIMYRPLFIREF